MREFAVFPFDPAQRDAFKAGTLWRAWADRYPAVFDEADRRLAESQGGMGYHFFEWLAAILLYEATGYPSLNQKYRYRNHTRKYALGERLLGQELWSRLISTSDAAGCQPPDLLTYKPDLTDWLFCEVKGPRDRLQPNQIAYFAQLEEITGREIRVVRFRPTAL